MCGGMSSIPPDHQACMCFIGNAGSHLTRPVTTHPVPVSPCTIASTQLAELSCWLSVMCPTPPVASIRPLGCPNQCDDSNCLAFASLLCKQVTYARVKTTCHDISVSVFVTCDAVLAAETSIPVQWAGRNLARAPPVGAPCVCRGRLGGAGVPSAHPDAPCVFREVRRSRAPRL